MYPSVNQSVYSLTFKETYSFEIKYRDIEEEFGKYLEAIFLKNVLDFLECLKDFFFNLMQTILFFHDFLTLYVILEIHSSQI